MYFNPLSIVLLQLLDLIDTLRLTCFINFYNFYWFVSLKWVNTIYTCTSSLWSRNRRISFVKQQSLIDWRTCKTTCHCQRDIYSLLKSLQNSLYFSYNPLTNLVSPFILFCISSILPHPRVKILTYSKFSAHMNTHGSTFQPLLIVLSNWSQTKLCCNHVFISNQKIIKF